MAYETFLVPDELELLEFFGAVPVERTVDDGYWCYEMVDDRDVRLRFPSSREAGAKQSCGQHQAFRLFDSRIERAGFPNVAPFLAERTRGPLTGIRLALVPSRELTRRNFAKMPHGLKA